MMKALKYITAIVLIILFYGGIAYAIKDRFDVVACLLILINAGAYFYFEIAERLKKEDPVEMALKNVFEPDNHMEFFDEGYLQGMQDLLQKRIDATPALIENFTISINALPKVKAMGRFVVLQLVDESYRVNFVKRYPDE